MKRIPLLIFGTILLLLFLVGAVQVYADRKAQEKVDSFLSLLELKDKASYGKVKYSLLKGTTEIKGLEIEDETGKLKAERLLITKFTETELELRIEGIDGEDKSFRELENSLRELGYKDTRMNAVLSVSLKDKEKKLLLRELSLEIPSAFRITVSFELLGVDQKLIKELSELEEDNREALNKLARELGNVKLVGMRAGLEDRGVLKKLIENEALKRGKKPEDIRDEILKELKRLEKGSEFERSLYTALKKLLEEGGSLNLIAKPQRPVPFDSLVVYALMSVQSKDFSRLFRVLNLKVEHKENI